MTTFFLNSSQKYPNKAFLIPNLCIFVLCEILQIEIVEGADFNYDNSFFKVLAPNYPNKTFLVLNLAFFVFWEFLQIGIVEGADLVRVMTILSNSSPKISKSDIFGSKFKHFSFCTELCNKTNSRKLISNMTIVFSNSSPKIRIKYLVRNIRIFIFHQTLQLD